MVLFIFIKLNYN